MADLTLPDDEPRVPPLGPENVNAYVKTEYDKSIYTWGIPNNLIRTMGWLPRLALTEVDYANSFIFDQGPLCNWPRPGNPSAGDVLFLEAGFVDRITKELVINLVSLLNRSRYSITHHSFIAFATLTKSGITPRRAEEMLLHLVDSTGTPTYDGDIEAADGDPLYNDLQLQALRVAERLRGDPHDVTDADFDKLRDICRSHAAVRIKEGVFQAEPASESEEYLEAFTNGMFVELTWCIAHFAGLLNRWFTVLKIADEDYLVDGTHTFIELYNANVPNSIGRKSHFSMPQIAGIAGFAQLQCGSLQNHSSSR